MEYYWMNKEHGYLVKEGDMYDDAVDCGYDEITDPMSMEWQNYKLRYIKMHYLIIE